MTPSQQALINEALTHGHLDAKDVSLAHEDRVETPHRMLNMNFAQAHRAAVTENLRAELARALELISAATHAVTYYGRVIDLGTLRELRNVYGDDRGIAYRRVTAAEKRAAVCERRKQYALAR